MQTKAIVIKKQNTGEYDQWVTCYTEEFGKLKTIAKSILKPSSIQALHLDIFNLAEFELINGRGMPIITGAQVIEPFNGVKGSLSKTAVAYFFAEAIDKMVFENDKDDELWSFLVSFLEELNKNDHNPNLSLSRFATGIPAAKLPRDELLSECPESQKDNLSPMVLLREGQIKLLDILGYFPETDKCKTCDANLGEDNFGAFNHVIGGVVCKRCFLSGHGGILISRPDADILLSLRQRDRSLLLNGTSTSAAGRSILDGMFEYISGNKFSSLELMNMLRY